jgi:hypothetical protein
MLYAIIVLLIVACITLSQVAIAYYICCSIKK